MNALTAVRPPITITLTGFDARVPIAAMTDLLAQYPTLEVGLLLSLRPEGRNRYPERTWLAGAAQALAGRCAIHVCGLPARDALLQGDLGDLLPYAPRIQVNGTLEAVVVKSLAARYPSHTIITQFHPSNATHLQVDASNHALLVDASGGRGLQPAAWMRPSTSKHVGFAGGLSLLNLRATLARIHPVAAGRYWIDMESSLRDEDDWFDLSVAERVLTTFEIWQRDQQEMNQVRTLGPGRVPASSRARRQGNV